MKAEVDKLLEFYEANKERIRNYINTCSYKDEECLFGELCFCILTPQSRAKNCREAINRLKKDKKLFTATADELLTYLRGVRFPEVKAQRLVEARKIFPELKTNLELKPNELRSWLFENVNGLGMKESAHFMRNIGFRGLPIIDVHIQNFLKKVGKHDQEFKSLTKKRYIILEGKFLELSKELKIPPEELDIAIWLYQSGEKEFYG
jgi:N-glycosylase/DNA lyase